MNASWIAQPARLGWFAAASAISAVASAQMQDVGLAIGDVNGDGSEDVVLADPHFEHDADVGMVHVLDGRTGAELWRASGTYGRFRAGLGVAVVTDHVAEPLVVIASRVESNGALRLELHRGKTGEILGSFDLPPTPDEFECSLATYGDLDGDGIEDLVVGRPWYSGRFEFSGSISIVSLREGCELVSRDGEAEREMLGQFVASGNFDRDGARGVVTTSGRRSGRSIVWLAGPTLRVLAALNQGGSCNNVFGAWLANLGERDGEGLDEVLAGSFTEVDNETGSGFSEAQVYSVGVPTPLLARRASPTADESPSVAVLRSRDGEVSIALGTPWEDGSPGIWRIFGAHGHLRSTHRDANNVDCGDDYYAVSLGACSVKGEPEARLIVLTERQDPRANYKHLCIGAECWGGANWATRLWVHDLEPDAVRGR